MFSRFESPPSTTGRMWSASHQLFRPRVIFSARISRTRRPNANRKTRRRRATVSMPQIAQIPRSRANTHSRRYDVLERRRHS